MSSASEPDPMIRLRRRPAAPVPGLRAGVLVALVLGGTPAALAAPPRAIPHLTDGPVRAIADRSTDPLANVPLRGRVAPRESMFGATNAPVATRPSVTVPATPGGAPAVAAPAPAAAPAPEPPPWSQQPAAYPSYPASSPSYPAASADAVYGAPASAAAPVDPRARSTPPLTAGPPPVRSALPYGEPGAAAPQRPEPVTVARPMPATPSLRPEIGTGPAAAAAAPPVAAPAPPVAPAPVAAPASPVTATLEPDGSVLLTWTVPASHVDDPFLVTVLGPDEETAMRTVRTAGPRWSYSPEAQRIDFGLPVTDRVCVRVRSASDGAGRMNVAPVCIQVSPAS